MEKTKYQRTNYQCAKRVPPECKLALENSQSRRAPNLLMLLPRHIELKRCLMGNALKARTEGGGLIGDADELISFFPVL